MAWHLKMFSVLLGLTFLVEFTMIFESIYFTRLLQHNILPDKPSTFLKYLNKSFNLKGNSWIYNPFNLFQDWVYFYYFTKIIFFSKIKKAINYLLWLFPVFWFVTVFFVFGFTTWNSYVIVVGATFTALLALTYFYQVLQLEEIVVLRYNSEFWIAIGMFIFYTCQVPYFGVLNFLIKNYQPLADRLISVLQVVASIMYLLFAYAFLCRINTKKF